MWKMKGNTGRARRVLVFVVKRLIMLAAMFAALAYVAHQNRLDYERTKDFDTISSPIRTP